MATDLPSLVKSLRTTPLTRASICGLVGAGFDIKSSNDIFIISPQYNRRDFSRPLSFDANGLVFDGSGKILALPIPSYNPTPQKPTDISKYLIQIVKDGTTITLYYNGEWKIATVGGIDMGGVSFCGKKTYREILDELCPNLTSKLDKAYSYTIGFHHSSYHPLDRVKNEVWLYAAADLSAINADEPSVRFCLPDIGLATPPTVSMTLAELLLDCESALKDYRSGGEARFGYILRGEFTDYGANAAFMLPSTLMKYLTKSFYNLAHTHKIKTTNLTRVKTTCILAYFDTRVGGVFWELFPEYAKYRDQIAGIISESVRQGIVAAGNKVQWQQLQRREPSHTRRGATGLLAYNALCEASKGGSFNPHEPNAQKILRECMVRSPKSDLVAILSPILAD